MKEGQYRPKLTWEILMLKILNIVLFLSFLHLFYIPVLLVVYLFPGGTIYSCLENSMDREEAWWAIVHCVAKNQT